MLHPIFKPNLILSALLAMGISTPALAANHREAPLTALDQKADITDFFAFVSYDKPDKVTLILNVDPLLEPANGRITSRLILKSSMPSGWITTMMRWLTLFLNFALKPKPVCRMSLPALSVREWG